jgi:hypothetical protein
MKITKKHNDGLTNFYNLDSGDIFLLDNAYYLKINAIELEDGSIVSAVRIDTGEVYWFANDERVEKVEAELIVEV